MPIIDVTKDPDNRTLRMTAHFNAPVARVWQVYADPRQLEKIGVCPPTRRQRSSATSSTPAAPCTTS